MPYENQIICGNSIELLNGEKPGWVDLVFADPPFNIGYLYHGYDDEKKAEVDIQKLTDKYVGDIDAQLAAKEKEILQV